MMQSEFENLLGHSVDYEEYAKIETVYMCFEKMSKQEIADFYKRNGEFVTTTLYNHVLDINKTIAKKDAKIDDLSKNLKNACETIGNLVEDNGQLQEVSSWAKKKVIEYIAETDELENRIEELETQLHQYKVLFAGMEKNATVNLYKTLLGVTE